MLSPEEDHEPWDDPWAVTWPEDSPAYFIPPDHLRLTPNEIRELQDALNKFASQVAGDLNLKHKIIVLPPGSKLT